MDIVRSAASGRKQAISFLPHNIFPLRGALATLTVPCKGKKNLITSFGTVDFVRTPHRWGFTTLKSYNKAAGDTSRRLHLFAKPAPATCLPFSTPPAAQCFSRTRYGRDYIICHIISPLCRHPDLRGPGRGGGY